jgi:ribosomal subunit interface protein
MKITISGKHMDVGEALKTHVEQHLEQTGGKYLDRITTCTVILDKDGHRFLSHISINTGTGSGVVIEGYGEGGDAYAAFDSGLEKIAKQLRRYKRRLKNHHVTVPDKVMITEYVVAAEHQEEELTEHMGDSPAIIAEVPKNIESMAVADAVMRMDLAHSNVYVFRNTKNGQMNVVYRRHDGNIGWIDPSMIKSA